MFKSYRAHNHGILDDLIKNFDNLPDVLREIKAEGNFMGIVTSKRHDMTIRGLKILGLDDIFEYLQGCDDFDDAHKPDPAVLLYACNRLELDPKDVLYVGDSIYDIQCANGAGCDSCAVL